MLFSMVLTFDFVLFSAPELLVITGSLLASPKGLTRGQAEQVEAWEGLPASLKMEVGSPYAFLCEQPRRLVVPQPMRGHPSIWDLPKGVVKNMEPALRVPDGVSWLLAMTHSSCCCELHWVTLH
jgi:hypothetical protein